MTDSVVLPLTGSGQATATAATETLAGAEHQLVIIEQGEHGSTTRVSTTHPLPVSDAGGSLTIDGTVEITNDVGNTIPVTDTVVETAVGAPADAAWASGNGSIIAVLKAIVAAVKGTLTVSGTVTTTPSGTQTVSGAVGVSGNVATTSAAASQSDGHSTTIGALADASSANTLVGLLKAIKAAITGTVAVSGTFWQSTQPVSGTVTITPSGTQTVTGTVTANVANPTSTLNAATQVAVTSTHGTILAAGTYKSVQFRNLSSSLSSVFVGPATVTATTGMEIKPGEMLSYGPGECPSNLIEGVCAGSGTATLIVQTSS